MKKILIATNNVSKFEVVVPLLKAAGFQDYNFVRPADLAPSYEVPESGSLQNRARSKAQAAQQMFGQQAVGAEIALYVGIDDGIRIEHEKTTFAASKEATDRILRGENIRPSDSVTIVRAFAFLTPDGGVESCTTRVPMTYLGNPDNIQRQEDIYPLEHVLAYEGSSQPIKDLDPATVQQLNSDYMRPTIQKAIHNLSL